MSSRMTMKDMGRAMADLPSRVVTTTSTLRMRFSHRRCEPLLSKLFCMVGLSAVDHRAILQKGFTKLKSFSEG